MSAAGKPCEAGPFHRPPMTDPAPLPWWWMPAGAATLPLLVAACRAPGRAWRAWAGETCVAALGLTLGFGLLPVLMEAWARRGPGAQPLQAALGLLLLGALASATFASLVDLAGAWAVGRLLPGWYRPTPAWRRLLPHACLAALILLALAGCGSLSALIAPPIPPDAPLPDGALIFLQDGHLKSLPSLRQAAPIALATPPVPAGSRLAFHPGPRGMDLCAILPDGTRHVLVAGWPGPRPFVPLFLPDRHRVQGKRLLPSDPTLDDTHGSWQPPASRPTDRWDISLGRSPEEGLEATHLPSGTTRQCRLATPWVAWEARCGSLVEPHWVVFQLGPQIALLDLSTGRLNPLVRGSSPVVVAHQASQPPLPESLGSAHLEP